MPMTDDVPVRNEQSMEQRDRERENANAVVEKEPAPDLSAKLDSKLEALVNGQAETRVLARFASDPNMREVLNAQQQGKKFKIVYEGQEEGVPRQEQKVPEKVDWDSLSNTQLAEKLPEVISGPMKSFFEEHMKSATQPLIDKIARLEQAQQSNEGEKITNQIKGVQKQYPDFDSYRTDMVALANQHPSLDAESLYILAKKKNGKLNLSAAMPTATERPTSSSSKPQSFSKLETKGRRRFEDALSMVLDSKDLSMDID